MMRWGGRGATTATNATAHADAATDTSAVTAGIGAVAARGEEGGEEALDEWFEGHRACDNDGGVDLECRQVAQAGGHVSVVWVFRIFDLNQDEEADEGDDAHADFGMLEKNGSSVWLDFSGGIRRREES